MRSIARAPWPNFGFGRGTSHPACRTPAMVASQPIAPRHMIERTKGALLARSASSHGAQVCFSWGVGLFCGGAQRTGAMIRTPSRVSPSPAAQDSGWLA